MVNSEYALRLSNLVYYVKAVFVFLVLTSIKKQIRNKTMNDGNDTQDAALDKARSPKYPIIGLKEAVDKAEKIWSKAGRHEVPVTSLADYWKISKTSSALIGYVAALLKFGLISDQGAKHERQVKLTPLGVQIVNHPAGSQERQKLLVEAAQKPEIYKELCDKYQYDFPDDSVIRPYLLIHKHFNQSAVDRFLRAFRETFDLANLNLNNKIQPDEEPRAVENTQNPQQINAVIARPAENQVIRELPIPLEGGLTARVPYPISESDFQILTQTLNLWKPRIVKKSSTPTPDPE